MQLSITCPVDVDRCRRTTDRFALSVEVEVRELRSVNRSDPLRTTQPYHVIITQSTGLTARNA